MIAIVSENSKYIQVKLYNMKYFAPTDSFSSIHNNESKSPLNLPSADSVHYMYSKIPTMIP